MIKALLIDDEQHCTDGLKAMLEQRFADDVEVVGVVNNPMEAPQVIHKTTPQVVFMDVEMPGINGIDLLKMIPEKKFELVFTTAYEKYALEAIKASAADYLIKPFSIEDLGTALQRCREKLDINQRLLATLNPAQKSAPQRFAITAENRTLLLVDPSEIIWIRAESNYSTLFFTTRPKLLVAKTLREFDEQLVPYNFFRIHSGSLINLSHIRSFHTTGGEEYVKMSNGDKVELARRRKAEFFELIRKI